MLDCVAIMREKVLWSKIEQFLFVVVEVQVQMSLL